MNELTIINSELNWLFNNAINSLNNNTLSFRGNLKPVMSRNVRGYLQSNGIQNHFGMGYFFSYAGFECEYREMENGQSVFLKTPCQ
jgi:hypothetical protein